MRRTKLGSLVAAAAVPALLAVAVPAHAAAPAPLGLACVAQNGVRFCQAHAPSPSDPIDTRTPSFDGVPLDADVTLPPADQGDGPFPTIAMLHGYGGSKADFETTSPDGRPDSTTPGRLYHWNNVWFAQNGYAVVNYSARGFGASCGSPGSRTPNCFQQLQQQDSSAGGWIHLKDRRREAHDTQWLLGALVDQGFTKPDALGATGISYGGGESIELAYLRDRVQKLSSDPTRAGDKAEDFVPWTSNQKHIPMTLSAAFPRWPWSDLVSSLLPNGRFLDYENKTAGLSRNPPGIPIQSYLSGLFALGATSGFYAPPGADMTADVINWNARVDGGDPYTDPYAKSILDQIYNFHQGFGTPGSTPAPLLIQNGWTDDLFPPAEALRVYNSLRAADPGADVALQFGDLGHSRGSNKTNADRAFNDQATAFFDKHLKGSSPSAPAPGTVTTFTQTCPKTADAGGPFTAASWPEIHPGAVRFGSAPAQTVTSAGGNPATGQAFDPIAGTTDSCKRVADETAQGTAVYRGPKFGTAFTLMGLPTVSAEIATTGPNGQLDSRLWDVAPDGQQTLISRAAYRLDDNQVNGRDEPLKFQLHGNGYVFAAGHVAKLELLGKDEPYLRPSNGAFQLSVKNLVVELPTVETFAAGTSAATAPFSTVDQPIVAPVLGQGGSIAAAQLKPKLRISYTPHRTRVGRRSRYLFRVRARSVATGRFEYIAGARLGFAGKRFRTDRRGRVRTHHRFHAPGRRAVRASKRGYRKRTVHVRVMRRHRR